MRARGTNPSRLLAYRTSGFTGQLLVVYRTWMEERLNTVLRLRSHGDFGIRARDVRVRLNAELGRVPSGRKNWNGLQRLLRALGFHRKLVLDYRVDPRALREQIAAIHPGMLAGPPSVLAQVALATLGQEPGGGLAAVTRFNTRNAEPGQRFSYASSESMVLGLVLARATRRSVSDPEARR